MHIYFNALKQNVTNRIITISGIVLGLELYWYCWFGHLYCIGIGDKMPVLFICAFILILAHICCCSISMCCCIPSTCDKYLFHGRISTQSIIRWLSKCLFFFTFCVNGSILLTFYWWPWMSSKKTSLHCLFFFYFQKITKNWILTRFIAKLSPSFSFS